ncbi:MAG: lactate utilization protein LutB domain-containing protein, partial [Pseudomonadota bacterium]
RWGLGLWRWLAARPHVYAVATWFTALGLRLWSLGKGRMRRIPLGAGWTDHRDFPTPEGGTFQAQWTGPRTRAGLESRS